MLEIRALFLGLTSIPRLLSPPCPVIGVRVEIFGRRRRPKILPVLDRAGEDYTLVAEGLSARRGANPLVRTNVLYSLFPPFML